MRKLISALLAVLLVAVFAAVTHAAGPAWVNIDPAGVSNNPGLPANNFGFNSVVVDPTTSTVYVGTNGQGIWRSTNGGSNWAKVNTGPGGALVDSGVQWTMALDPFNSQTIYTTAARGDQGVLKSTDGGVSWQQVFPWNGPVALQIGTNDVYSIDVDPHLPGHLLAAFHYYWNGGNASGVVESLDGGATWIKHAPPSSTWGAGNGVWFGNTSATWIVGSQSAGLWITSNSGSSWRQITVNSITHGATEALYRDPGTGALIIADGTTVLKSLDNGVTWQDIGAGLPYSYYETVVSDGVNLFTAASFPVLGDNGAAHNSWFTRPIGSGTWTAYSSQMPCDPPTGYCNGPVQGAYDPLTHTIYTANWNGGAWKLQTGAAAPAATPTSTPAAPTATPTATVPPPAATSTPTAVPTIPPTPTSTATCAVVVILDGEATTVIRPSTFCTDQP